MTHRALWIAAEVIVLVLSVTFCAREFRALWRGR